MARPERTHTVKTEFSPAVGQTCRVQDGECTSKLAEGTTLGQMEQGENGCDITFSHSPSKTAVSSNTLLSTLMKEVTRRIIVVAAFIYDRNYRRITVFFDGGQISVHMKHYFNELNMLEALPVQTNITETQQDQTTSLLFILSVVYTIPHK